VKTSITIFSVPIGSAFPIGVDATASYGDVTVTHGAGVPLTTDAMDGATAAVGVSTQNSHTEPVNQAALSGGIGSLTVPQEGAQVDKDADFLARVTAPNNIWGHNFSNFVYESGVEALSRPMDSLTQIQADSASQGIGTGSDLARETTLFLSGSGSIDTLTYDTTGRGDGSYNCQGNGSDATEIDRYYCQFSVYYPRETAAWRYPISGSTSFKIAEFGNFGSGAYVLATDRFMGFPAGYVTTGSGAENLSQHVGSTFTGTPWGFVLHIQNAIDSGTPASPTTKDEWLTRYGYLLGGMEDDMDWGEGSSNILPLPDGSYWLDQQTHAGFGWPDSRAATNGKQINIGGWTTFEIFIDRANNTLQIWMANYGDAPTLVWEGIGNVTGLSGTSSARNEHYFLNYDTARQSQVGVRPTPQHTYFDEIIFSYDPIPFPNPGGTPHALTGNLGGASSLSQAAVALSAGGDADFAAGHIADSMAFIGSSQGLLDWTGQFWHDPNRQEIQVIGKVQSGGPARHVMFDEATDAWRIVVDGLFNTELGHSSYSNFIDTSTGDAYFQVWTEERFRRYTRSTDAWDYNTAFAVTGSAWFGSAPASSCLHPTLFTAKADQRGMAIWTGGRIHAYSLEDEDDLTLALLSGDRGHSAPCMYSPGLNKVIMGAGGTSTETYLMTPGNPPTYARIVDSPVTCRANGSNNIMTMHPVTGMPMILQRDFGIGSLVWNYNESTDSWDQNDTHPFGTVTPDSLQWIPCSMPEYGVVAALYKKGTGANNYDLGFHIWKPSV
jgi:hypothetical protein